MIRNTSTAALFCIVLMVYAQPGLTQLAGKITYPEFYRFQIGDDSTWAQAEFDDTGWQQKKNASLPNWKGIAWFRFVMELDTSLWRQSLGLMLQADGAAQFYLDGKLVHQVGKVGNSPKNERLIFNQPRSQVVTFYPTANVIENKARHVVAVRYANSFLKSSVWDGYDWRFWWYVTDAENLLNDISRREEVKRRATFHQMFLMGIFLSFSVLHFLLFYFYPGLRLNLYFAGMTLFISLSTFLDFQRYFASDPDLFYKGEIFLNITSVLAALAAMRFIHGLFYQEVQKIFIAFLIAGLVVCAWGSFKPFSPAAIRDYFIFVAVIEVARCLILARVKKRSGLIQGTRMIVSGTVLMLVVAFLDGLVELDIILLPWWNTEFPSAPYAAVILTVSVSAALAFTFANVSRDLQSKKVELEGEIREKTQTAEKLQSALAEVEHLKNRLQAENIYLQDEIKLAHNFSEIISRSDIMKKVLGKVEQVASTDATVLVLGESGTGKELFVRALHDLSMRRERALVKVNCAALPANLIESELFGHEKGAFTGALARKIGRFELANSGTIFLDEIGELPLELQAKLLRVLQEGEFERLGHSETISVDVRVIAATNRDLEKAIQQGVFREDLYYRLNVFPITIPPLRERRDDIPLLVHHFIKKYNAKTARKIATVSQNVMDVLQAYSWPGNVRELENVIERAVIISPGKQLKLDEWLPDTDSSRPPTQATTLEESEKAHILKVLEATNWRVSGAKGAAKILGINDKTLHWRMKKLGIHKNQK